MTSGKRFSKIELDEQHHFDLYATKYDANYSYTDSFTQYKISKKATDFVKTVEKIYGSSDIKILELGCGTGEYTKHIARQLPNAKIIGIDISPNMLNIARKKCKGLKNVSFENESVYDTSFKDATFDVICGYYILHHLTLKRIQHEILRILKPHGYVYFYEPNILNPMVYLIKSNKKIKKMVGDSANEWAINPLGVMNIFKGFKKVKMSTTEFVYPFKWLGLNFNKYADKLLSLMGYLPVLNYFGGSVKILLQKK